MTDALTAQFGVSSGPKTLLAFRASPVDGVAGSTLAVLQVEILDALGNLTTDATDDVTMTLLNANGATLDGTVSVLAVGGVATFSTLSVKKAGAMYQLSAGATGLTSATSNQFAMTAGPAATLGFEVQPSNVGITKVITPSVKVAVRDQYGNAVTSTATISLTLSTGSGLGGTTTHDAVAGVATFDDLHVDALGDADTLTATADALTSATSTPFTVSAGPPTKLVLTAQPAASMTAGSAFAVTVQAQDADGNPVAAFTGNVTLALADNTTGGVLGGQATKDATAGQAAFTGLSIGVVGTYTISAT